LRTERVPDRNRVRDDRNGVRNEAEYCPGFGGIGKKETERIGRESAIGDAVSLSLKLERRRHGRETDQYEENEGITSAVSGWRDE
jgi:hypothetical protein